MFRFLKRTQKPMNKIYTLFFFLCSFTLTAQEPHLRKAKTLEELMKENRPNEYRALINHDYYLVFDKIGGKKRKKIFTGDPFYFRSKEDVLFIGDLVNITDSSFTILYEDQTMNRFEKRTFQIDEVKAVYKNEPYKGIRYRFTPAIFLPFALDWIYFKRPPWQQLGSVAYLGGIEALRVLITNREKIGNKQYIGRHKRLMVLKY